MASSNRASTIFLISLVIFAAANPLAHATIINSTLKGVNVNGQLCCTSNGNCPGQGVVGAVVSLNCSTLLGTNVTLGQATTSANGTFNITVPTVTGLVLGLPTIPCVVTVGLPLNSTICPVLSTVNGTLASTLVSVGTLLNNTLGLLQSLTLAGFVRVSI